MQAAAKTWSPEPVATVSRPVTEAEPVVVTYGPPPFHPLEDLRAIWREWRHLMELRKDLHRAGE
jgi:hypothetical protein